MGIIVDRITNVDVLVTGNKSLSLVDEYNETFIVGNDYKLNGPSFWYATTTSTCPVLQYEAISQRIAEVEFIFWNGTIIEHD